MTTRKSIEKEVRSIVKQLAELYHPEKVILFGSLLEGKARPKDIDLFIIKENPPRVGVDRIRELDRMIEQSTLGLYRQERRRKAKQRNTLKGELTNEEAVRFFQSGTGQVLPTRGRIRDTDLP
jgi:predicted nucleotidyltransferase